MPITPVVKGAFPAAKLQAALESWWDSKKNAPLAPPKPDLEGTILDLQPELTSQQAVIVLLDCEEILGYQPSKKAIKRGGYMSRTEFLKGLMKELRAEWDAKHSSKPPAAVPKETITHATAVGF